MNKQEIEKEIQAVFQKARDLGYEIVVARDEEGNGYNRIIADSMFYEDTKDMVIALAVFDSFDEDNIFQPHD